MAFLTWSNELSVGVVELDEQHKKLFGYLNEFYDSIQSDNKKALKSLIDSLMEYALYHFRTEEKYFDKFGYEDSEFHKKEHQDFVDRVLDFKNKFESGKLVVSLTITNFLKNWIKEHIKISDKRYGKCFNSNGLN